MYSQFIRAIKWNTAGIVLYKIILFAHQTFLYGSIPQTEYGIVGTLFSTIYFLIPVSNFGFDYTILSFFEKSQSAEESSFIFRQYFYRVCLIVGMIMIATGLFFFFGAAAIVPLPLFIVCVALFFFENIKHSLRTHAHIFHLNKKIAIFENISLLTYIATVWAYFILHQSIPTMLLFLPLTITSAAETAFIGSSLLISYRTATKQKTKSNKSHCQFFKESAFNYINQLAKAFYSPNFLIIFLAATVGFQKTGYIKFVTNIIIFLYTIFYRSIHMSGGALFASISKMPHQLIKKTFNNITNYYIQILATISIYFSGLLYLHAQKPPAFEQAGQFSIYAIIIAFCLISFLEYGTLTYETLFISQKKGRLLAVINGLNILGALLFLAASYLYPSPSLLILLCLLKLATTAYTMIQAYIIWDISTKVSINKAMLFAHLSIALSLVSYFA